MKRLIVIIVWLILFIVDGIVLPALTGLPSGFGAMVLLSALAITFSIHRWVVGLGLVLAGTTELMLGSYFGTVIGAWLVMAWCYYFLNQLLNLKPMSENDSFTAFIPLTLLGLVVFFVGEGALWAITRFVYEPQLALATLFQTVRSPVIFFIIITELLLVLFVFRFIYSSKDYIYAG